MAGGGCGSSGRRPGPEQRPRGCRRAVSGVACQMSGLGARRSSRRRHARRRHCGPPLRRGGPGPRPGPAPLASPRPPYRHVPGSRPAKGCRRSEIATRCIRTILPATQLPACGGGRAEPSFSEVPREGQPSLYERAPGAAQSIRPSPFANEQRH
ncbi:unnamed protein product, partial [Iphiclides podalirius]